MSALLRPGSLVLDMDAGRALFHKHLCELHHGGEASVAGVGVGDDGPEEVGVGEFGTCGLGDAEALFALLAVVEELGKPQMLHLSGNGVLNTIVSFVFATVVRRGLTMG
jgi:hypothetical protein